MSEHNPYPADGFPRLIASVQTAAAHACAQIAELEAAIEDKQAELAVWRSRAMTLHESAEFIRYAWIQTREKEAQCRSTNTP